MPTGTVKWFNQSRGYGIIAPHGLGRDLFVHMSAVRKSGLRRLEDHQKIIFEVEPTGDGRESATNLSLR